MSCIYLFEETKDCIKLKSANWILPSDDGEQLPEPSPLRGTRSTLKVDKIF